MSDPFLAEVMIVGFNFAPRGWAGCDGQILPINQNQSLYSLLGTTYGGDGRTTFGLPDLRGRTPMHVGTGFNLGQKGGEDVHNLSVAEMPNHNHQVMATGDPSTDTVPDATKVLGTAGANIYRDVTAPVNMHAGTIQPTGNGQGHQNMSPYQVLNFVICLTGLFPSRN